jgi:heme oxygenase-like protein
VPSMSPNGQMVVDRQLQIRLSDLNRWRFTPSVPEDSVAPDWLHETVIEEQTFLATERMAVSAIAAEAPTEVTAFIAWFENLKVEGPGQQDELFPWLAAEADLDQMKWFLSQEIGGEAGFEDLTALTQLKFPVRPKLELARNYWDEMGRGNPKAMHGPLLEALANHLDLTSTTETTVEEALALANTMAGLAAHRQYAYHSIGALGVIEMTAPGRSAMTTAGLKRLGIKAKDRMYFSLHAVLDVKHSLAWNAEVIAPLVEADARFATAIAEGALMRLRCGARCFERYRQHFALH